MSNVPDRPDQGDARKKILLAAPRGWCAGVGRAVEVVERLLRHHGPPVYVRKQIVHNLQVVHELERKGVVFVESEEDVPPGSICALSAHGVAPAVRENARRRALQVVDATCPLVAKVHTEARRLARAGKTIFLIGHANHEEIEGTSGEASDAIEVIEGPEDAERATPPTPRPSPISPRRPWRLTIPPRSSKRYADASLPSRDPEETISATRARADSLR